jgi:hypothetical protein
MEWETIDRPGYFGKHREERTREYNARYGEGNWRIAWEVGEVVVDKLGAYVLYVVVDKLGAYALYEDAYFEFFRANPEVLQELVLAASDVYDDAQSNVHSGLDYTIQETGQTHLQDVSIRRCLVRLGLRFKGRELIQIRSTSEHRLGKLLTPGRVPFHRLDLIKQPELEGWWDRGSIESFYQSNKVLQIKR